MRRLNRVSSYGFHYHTDSESVANQKAGPVWAQLIEGWEAKLAGGSTDAEQRFAAARDLAAARGAIPSR